MMIFFGRFKPMELLVKQGKQNIRKAKIRAQARYILLLDRILELLLYKNTVFWEKSFMGVPNYLVK